MMRLLDGAVLAVAVDEIRKRIDEDDVLVFDDGGRVSGTIVLDGARIIAIAVRPARRDQGIGRRLVDAARTRRARLTADFDGDVRAFYATLGFEIRPVEGELDRFRGVLE